MDEGGRREGEEGGREEVEEEGFERRERREFVVDAVLFSSRVESSMLFSHSLCIALCRASTHIYTSENRKKPTKLSNEACSAFIVFQYEKRESNCSSLSSSSLSLDLLTAYAKNSVTILEEPLSVMVLRVVVA